MARPEDMAKYQQLVPDAPERIFRMAEARTVDDSRRLDLLVAAEIAQVKTDRAIAVIFLLIFTAASVIFFALGNPIGGMAMLGLPVLGIVRTMWASTAHGSRHSGDGTD